MVCMEKKYDILYITVHVMYKEKKKKSLSFISKNDVYIYTYLVLRKAFIYT